MGIHSGFSWGDIRFICKWKNQQCESVLCCAMKCGVSLSPELTIFESLPNRGSGKLSERESVL